MEFDINNFEDFRLHFESIYLRENESVNKAIKRILDSGYTFVSSEDGQLLLEKAQIYGTEYIQRIKDAIMPRLLGSNLLEDVKGKEAWYQEGHYDDSFLEKLVKSRIISVLDIEESKKYVNRWYERFMQLVESQKYYSIAQKKLMLRQFTVICETTSVAGAYLQWHNRKFIDAFDELPPDEALVEIQNTIIGLEREAKYPTTSGIAIETIRKSNQDKIEQLKQLKKKKKLEKRQQSGSFHNPTQDKTTNRKKPAKTNLEEYASRDTINIKNDVQKDLFSILKDHFPKNQEEELMHVLSTGENANTGENAKRKLFFQNNGNKLADAFKQLYNSGLVTDCTKQELESWILTNFVYRDRSSGKAKEFTKRYLNDIISTNKDKCQRPIVDVKKKEGKYTIESA